MDSFCIDSTQSPRGKSVQINFRSILDMNLALNVLMVSGFKLDLVSSNINEEYTNFVESNKKREFLNFLYEFIPDSKILRIEKSEQEDVTPPFKKIKTSESGVELRTIPAVVDPILRCLNFHLVPWWLISTTKGEHLNYIVKLFNEKMCLNTYSHLKRIKNNKKQSGEDEILLQVTSANQSNRCDIQKIVCDLEAKYPNYHFELRPSWLPFTTPLTRFQQSCLNHHPIFTWPTTLHPNKHIEKLTQHSISQCFFEETELNRLQQSMELINNDCYTIDWEETDQCCLLEGDIFKVLVSQTKGDSLIVCAVRCRCLSKPSTQNPFLHPIIKSLNSIGKGQMYSDEDTGYLLSNFDVFLSSEPCTMCAMALLHSRVNRVFILSKKNNICEDYGFTNNWQLNDIKKLNHRFLVFSPQELC